MVAGYLVAQTRSVAHAGDWYRGPYNKVPWDQEAFERGFKDPYVFENWADENHLTIDPNAAIEIRDRYAEIYPHEEMEILWFRSVGDPAAPPSRSTFLGFDVACGESPFYSLLADQPVSPPDPIGKCLSLLNDNGLFQSAEDARRYIDLQRRYHPGDLSWEDVDYDSIMVLEVFLLENHDF